MRLLARKLNKALDKKEKLKFFLLAFGMFIGSISEIISIALIIPFISLTLGNQESSNNKVFLTIQNFVGIESIIILGIVTISIFIISFVIRLFILDISNKFAAYISNRLVYKAYHSVLNENYEYFIKESKSKLISIIHTNGSRILIDLIMSLLVYTESILFLFLIVITLLLYSWQIFIIISFFLIIIYTFFIKKSNKTLNFLSKRVVELNKNSLEKLDIDLNSIEYIHLGNFQEKFSINYAQNDKKLKFDYAKYIIIGRTPRIIIEYILLITIILLMVILYSNNLFVSSLPIIAAGGLLAQKTLPHMQKIFESWAQITNNKISIISLLDYSTKYKKNVYKKQNELSKYLSFSSIIFEDVCFSYQKEKKFLNQINFSVKRGEKVALMGPSGSGKTTILRLICGLLSPTSGKVIVNDVDIGNKYNYSNKISWMRTIGYVPQKINLTGRTLRENIIFDNKSNNLNSLTIEEIVKITLLDEIVERCKGLDTNIIQNSFSLSGGENQRIAIARALYRNPRLLIMDEPTSALDRSMQKKLFDNLHELSDMTCIVITHRTETKYFFDKIFEIKEKKLFLH